MITDLQTNIPNLKEQQNKLVIYKGDSETAQKNGKKRLFLNFIFRSVKLLLNRIPEMLIICSFSFAFFQKMSGNAVVNNDKPVLAPASIALTASKSRQIPTKSYWIVVGVGALVFTLLKWVYFKPPTDRERAQKLFQLKLEQTNKKQVNWVYNTKKKYYGKFQQQSQFYRQKMQELNQLHAFFIRQLQNRAIKE